MPNFFNIKLNKKSAFNMFVMSFDLKFPPSQLSIDAFLSLFISLSIHLKTKSEVK
jgi:hypothetical protein